MLLPFKLFAGGPIASGEQVVSWIHRDDLVALVLLSLDREQARGPINAVAPNAVTNAELAKAIGRAMGRSSWFRVPKIALRARLGEAAETVATGQRVVPRRAEELGYRFRYAEVDDALRSILSS